MEILKSECPTCGAKTVKYKHTLNQNLVKALDRFYESEPPINLKVVGFTRNQWDNFQKLRYWELVTKHYVDGKRIGGVWNITDQGKRFLQGILAVPRRVVTYRGDRESYEGELVKAKDLWGDFNYRKREDYAADAEPQLQLYL